MTETLLRLWDDPFTHRIALVVLGVSVVWLLRHFVNRALNQNIKDTGNKYKARKAVNLIGYFLMISVLLFVFSDKLGNIGVVLGVAGAGIAFALQEVVVSLAGWLNIMITGTVSVGQRVKIGETKGDIVDIGILSTTIMEIGDWVQGDLYNGRIVTFANSFVYKEKVFNYSAEFPFLWDEVYIPIRTDSDYELAREIFTAVLIDVCGDYGDQSKETWLQMTNKYRVEDAIVKPMVTLSFNENWITFTLRYVVEYKRRRTTKDQIFSKSLEAIKASNGRVKIAVASIEVTQA